MEKPGIEPATPGLQGIALIHYTTGYKKKKKTFCGFPWVETSTAGRVYDLCVYYMTGAPEGSPRGIWETSIQFKDLRYFSTLTKSEHNGYLYDANINFSAAFLVFGFSD